MLEHIEHLNNLKGKPFFYRAVVEDNDDSKEKGGSINRCRVRILGIHSQEKTRTGKNKGVPKSELPWAEVIQPITMTSGSDSLSSSAVPTIGSWVWIFFDGGNWNKPIIIGLIKTGGNKKSKNKSASEVKKANRDKGIPTSKGGTWGELEDKSSKSKYPHNTVFKTTGGSMVEYDSTEGNERIHFFHKSGSFWEIQDNGDYQLKTVGDRIEIANKDYKRLIKNNFNSSVQGNVEIKYDGNETILVGGTKKETVSGGIKTDGGPEINLSAGIIKLN